jgi:hypothetical protein
MIVQKTRRTFVRQIVAASSLIASASLPLPARSVSGASASRRTQAGASSSKGEASGRLPAWVPRPGEFSEFTRNTPASVGATAAIFANWCGGTFVDDYGAMGAAAYHGGGEHFSWPDKGGVLVLDCDKRIYAMRCLSSVTTHRGVAGNAGSPVNDWGCYADNDYPQSKHTYNCLSQMPREWGGGPMGALVRVGHSGGLLNAPDGKRVHGYSATYRFDLSQEIDGHSRLTGNNKYVLDSSGNPASINDSAVSCMDSRRQGWWTFSRTSAGLRGLSFTHRTGTIANFAAPGLALAFWAKMHHFADEDVLCVMCDEPSFGTNLFGVVKLLDLSALPRTQWISITPDRPDDSTLKWQAPGSIQCGYIGPQWSPILQAFVAIDMRNPNGVSDTIRIWKLAPPRAGDRFTGKWTWTLETAKSADGSTINVRKDSGSVNGPFGKLVECPALRSLVWTRGPDARGQLIRLAGME